MDSIDSSKRSWVMSRVRSRNTKVEIDVRKLIYSLGLRYRLHDNILPGKPDLVLKSRNTVVFINGCFWHRHSDCKLARMPKSRVLFWEEKLNSNKAKDERNWAQLEKMGWRLLIVWECELGDKEKLISRIRSFFNV